MSVDLKARAAQAVDIAQDAGAEDAWSTVSQSELPSASPTSPGMSA